MVDIQADYVERTRIGGRLLHQARTVNLEPKTFGPEQRKVGIPALGGGGGPRAAKRRSPGANRPRRGGEEYRPRREELPLRFHLLGIP